MLEHLDVSTYDDRPPDGVCQMCGLPMTPFRLPYSWRWAPPGDVCRTCREADESLREQAEASRRIQAAGVALRHLGMSLDHTDSPARGERLEDFEIRTRCDPERRVGVHSGNAHAASILRDWLPRTGGSVYLHGMPGSGKTFLLELVAIRLLSVPLTWEVVTPQGPGRAEVLRRRGGYSVVVTTEADLVARVRRRRAGLSDADTVPHPLDAPKRAGTLVLDELGRSEASKSATPAADIIEEVVDHRYRAGLPILCASNHPLSRLGTAGGLGLRVQSRLEEMCARRVVEVSGHWRTAT